MVAQDGIEPPTHGSSVNALPTELLTQIIFKFIKMAVPTGLEPATSCVTGRHLTAELPDH